MPRLTVDNQLVEVAPGDTILDAARKLGIEIPTLCFREGCSPSTSCMVCLVRLAHSGRLVPACGSLAEEGLRVESDTTEVREARREALELLLSDHLGDCIGPCHSICPAHMNIPQMIRQIASGALRDAIATVKETIALPAVLGRICPAPCEKGCRRGQFADCRLPIADCRLGDKDRAGAIRGADAEIGSRKSEIGNAVSICLLKRYVADVDLASAEPYLPARKPATGKRVAIVGAGPAGLAAAYYLLQEGHACTLFDDHETPGGMLQYGVPEDRLPRDALDAEIAVILRLGAELRPETRVGEQRSLAGLRQEFDAVLVAAGELKEGDAARLGGLPTSAQGLEVNRETLQTPVPGVFAAGSAVRKQKMAVRAVADGKTVAASIDQFLRGLPVTGPRRVFSTHIGRLKEAEIGRFMAEAGAQGDCPLPIADCRLPWGTQRGPAQTSGEGLKSEIGNRKSQILDHLARQESRRCLHCDCRKPDACKLRYYADLCGANPGRYGGGSERRVFEQHVRPPDVVYEPGKCIACGLCIQIAARAGEALGLTFIGRGFDVRVGVPFHRSIAEGLVKAAADCVAACPTGALAFR